MMTMKLKRFRVTNFRSVEDSGWIETESVTALIGTNESGKSNLLIPLWKLNPAKDGAISPLADMPRKRYHAMRSESPSPKFIEAVFEPDAETATTLSSLTGLRSEEFREISIGRLYDGTHEVVFQSASPARSTPTDVVRMKIAAASAAVEAVEVTGEQGPARAAVGALLSAAEEELPADDVVTSDVLEKIEAQLAGFRPQDEALVKIIGDLHEGLGSIRKSLGLAPPGSNKEARQIAINAMPKFVYYSNYGNLDSEIYLPHVIENKKRKDLGSKEEAKARTLKVLFEFVKLKADEILALGREFRDPSNPTRLATPDEASAIAQKKKERSVLLQSAGTQLTNDFRAWWKQGDYRFRFDADGDHFRIWVADDRRPEEVELEGRSTGLQWFLSFYLVFLVESQDSHSGCILLLDEPGLSLHPLAQKDLSRFFEGLAKENQLVYTTHSPFLVDADNLHRVRKVYVAPDGATKATPDLGASGGHSQQASGYAVHAALGLTVAESLLVGCTPVLVEGPSDQHYLTGIKSVLARTRRYTTGRELIFPPVGGVKGVKPVVAIIGGRDGELPRVLLDSDKPGRTMADHLRSDLYSSDSAKVLDVATFTSIPDSEVEDLIPMDIISREVDRLFRAFDRSFEDVAKPGRPIVGQIEEWAKSENIELTRGWKVDLARRVKEVLLRKGLPEQHPLLNVWTSLFERLAGRENDVV